MRLYQIVCIICCVAGLLTDVVNAQPAAETKPATAATIDISAGIPAGTESAATVRIRKILAEPTDVDFQETPLNKAVDALQAKFGINIQLDERALNDAGTGLEVPITRHLKAVSLRSALRLILGPMDLAYVIKDDVLLITTKERADGELTTRFYPVGDLLDRSLQYNLNFEPAGDLIYNIVATVAPTTWDEVGGPGSITYFPIIESLIISQTAEVHEQIRELLTGMRKVMALGLPKDHRAAAKDDELFVALYWLDVPNQSPQPAAMAGAKRPSPPEKGPAAPSPETSLAAGRALAEDVARAVPNVIEPKSWKANGGQGTIEAVGFGVAVRQTRAVHLQVATLLRSIVKARKPPVPPLSGGMAGAGKGSRGTVPSFQGF